MFHKSSTNLSLFDIRIKSPYKNLILVKGSEYESPSIFLSGSVVLSIPEDTHCKKVNLRLYGEYKLEFMESLTARNISSLVKQRLVVLDVYWDNLLCDDNGEIRFGNYGDSFKHINNFIYQQKQSNSNLNSFNSNSNNNSSTDSSASSSRPSLLRSQTSPVTKSSIPIVKVSSSGISGTPFPDLKRHNVGSFFLPKGNYELPFKCILPGNIPETIEGLKVASILYKFETNVEKGRFEKNLTKYKHLRIQRTVTNDHMGLVESVNINNTWPGKVQYDVSLPKKAIPVGSITPIDILIVPIAKGLAFEEVTASLHQHYFLKDIDGNDYDHEDLISNCEISNINKTMNEDKWDIQIHIKIPHQLKYITQGCEIKNDFVKVKHKLKLFIKLKNKDGHFSELRANLPIFLYISPSVPVNARKIEIDNHGKFHIIPNEEERLFRTGNKDDDIELASNDINRSLSTSALIEKEMVAPPIYQNHVYDRIFDNSSNSGLVTPISVGATSNEASEFPSYFEIPENHSRQISSAPVSPNGARLMNNIDSIDNRTDDLIEQFANSTINLPKISSINLPILNDASVPKITLDVNELSKVPSYNYAIDDINEDSDLAPVYIDENNKQNGNPRPVPTKIKSTSSIPFLNNKNNSSVSSFTSKSNSNIKELFNRKITAKQSKK